MRPVRFLGDSLQCCATFLRMRGMTRVIQLDKIQRGDLPDDFKPMTAIGKGVEEIRVLDPSGAYRVIYFARRADAVYVRHAFHKKDTTDS